MRSGCRRCRSGWRLHRPTPSRDCLRYASEPLRYREDRSWWRSPIRSRQLCGRPSRPVGPSIVEVPTCSPPGRGTGCPRRRARKRAQAEPEPAVRPGVHISAGRLRSQPFGAIALIGVGAAGVVGHGRVDLQAVADEKTWRRRAPRRGRRRPSRRAKSSNCKELADPTVKTVRDSPRKLPGHPTTREQRDEVPCLWSLHPSARATCIGHSSPASGRFCHRLVRLAGQQALQGRDRQRLERGVSTELGAQGRRLQPQGRHIHRSPLGDLLVGQPLSQE